MLSIYKNTFSTEDTVSRQIYWSTVLINLIPHSAILLLIYLIPSITFIYVIFCGVQLLPYSNLTLIRLNDSGCKESLVLLISYYVSIALLGLLYIIDKVYFIAFEVRAPTEVFSLAYIVGVACIAILRIIIFYYTTKDSE